MIRYAFELTDFPRWAGGLAQLLQFSAHDPNEDIDSFQGTGYVRTGRLYAGISFLVMDLTVKEELTFSLLPSASPAICLQFNLQTSHPTVRLCSTGNSREMTYSRNTRIRKIGILAAASFLRRHFLKPILADLFRQANLSPNSYAEPVPFDNRGLLNDILRENDTGPLRHLHLHNRLLFLAERYLYGFIYKSGPPPIDRGNWPNATEKDLDALRVVMKTLTSSKTQKFPSIESLSNLAMMSSTKLKTRFKQLYGMKLYEFYNHHRLLRAQQLLRAGSHSVKQVGNQIGFASLSNFAKAFKREFGVLPREILTHK